MFRGLMTIVTAVAVLWHTVAGCCAHHRHNGHSCEAADNAASIVHDSNLEVSDGCCKHALADSEQFCASTSSGHQLGEGSPGTPCPEEGPSGCKQSTCGFAAPNSSGSTPLDHLDLGVTPLGYAVIDVAVLLSFSCAKELHESTSWSPLGCLRLHLAHCVLTL